MQERNDKPSSRTLRRREETTVSSVAVLPIQWRSLSDIDDVRPIDDTDAPVLDDIRTVLEKHGSLDRFGVALLHRHFDVADSELMLETTDVSAREHWVRPVRRAELAAKGLTVQSTILRFDETGPVQYCGCSADGPDGHGHPSFTPSN
jgi:hypothetical protein